MESVVDFLSKAFLTKSSICSAKKYTISSQDSNEAHLDVHREVLDQFELWIFVSSSFDFSSFELKTD
jgi:hypothetical protein